MKNKRGFFIWILVILILLIIGFFIFIKFNSVDNVIIASICKTDADCIKVQTSCCPCSSSGQEECVSINEKLKYEEILQNCSEKQICAAVYTCVIESCSCIEGNCVANINGVSGR